MTFSEFRRQHAGFVVAIAIVAATLIGVDALVLVRRARYLDEIERLRAGMSDFERKRTDAVTNLKERQLPIMLELVRRQAQGDADIHLAVSVDSSRMYLERQGAVLREFPVEVGPARRIGIGHDTVRLAVPRGSRSVQHVAGPDEPWDVPSWVFHDRGIDVPADRKIPGALGPGAVLLDGGTIIYALPEAGPLNDSSYVLPGSIRARAEDLRAIAPNLGPGTAVYFY